MPTSADDSQKPGTSKQVTTSSALSVKSTVSSKPPSMTGDSPNKSAASSSQPSSTVTSTTPSGPAASETSQPVTASSTLSTKPIPSQPSSTSTAGPSIPETSNVLPSPLKTIVHTQSKPSSGFL